jgi:hypothetical protein
VQIPLNRRQRHAHHGDVQQQHERGRAHQRQSPPLAWSARCESRCRLDASEPIGVRGRQDGLVGIRPLVVQPARAGGCRCHPMGATRPARPHVPPFRAGQRGWDGPDFPMPEFAADAWMNSPSAGRMYPAATAASTDLVHCETKAPWFLYSVSARGHEQSVTCSSTSDTSPVASIQPTVDA